MFHKRWAISELRDWTRGFDSRRLHFSPSVPSMATDGQTASKPLSPQGFCLGRWSPLQLPVEADPASEGQSCLHEYLIDDPSMHIGQTKLATLVPIRKLRMIHSQTVQNCGLQVMDMHGAFFNAHT